MKRYPFRVLVLCNEVPSAFYVREELKKVVAYEKQNTLLDIEFTYKTVDLGELEHESFGVRLVSEGEQKELYGLKGIKQKIRDANLCPLYLFHSVIFLYDVQKTEAYKENKSIAHWTYFSELYPGTEFTEILLKENQKDDELFRVCTHELRHVYVNRARKVSLGIYDVMDKTTVQIDCATQEPLVTGLCTKEFPYYKEKEIFAKDGNRGKQNLLLAPFWDKIAEQKILSIYIQYLMLKVKLLTLQKEEATGHLSEEEKVPEVKHEEVPAVKKVESKLVAWAQATKEKEGWYPGSRSYRNNNPGNVKFVGQILALKTPDDKGFAIFPTYEAGWKHLLKVLENAATGKSTVYKPTMTLYQYYAVYAPDADNNNSKLYAEQVAQKLGVLPTTKIKDLLAYPV